MTVRVLTALSHQWETAFVTALDRTHDVTLVRRCADLADLLAAAAAGLADVAIVSADLRGLDRDALSQLNAQRVRAVGAVSGDDENEERRLRQLGVGTILSVGAQPDEIERALSAGGATRAPDGLEVLLGNDPDGLMLPGTAANDHRDGSTLAALTTELELTGEADSDGPTTGRIVAVWGPTGAPGRTTLAVNVAAELAGAGVSTLLVDADTYGASIAQALSLLDEAPGMAAAARASELGTLDLPVLARLSPAVGKDLRVLTGIPRADRWPELRASAVEQVLRLGRQLVEVVVVDCGFSIEADEELSYDTLAPRRNATTLVALEEADDLLVVGSAEPVGLQRLVRAVQDIGAVQSPKPQVVINRVRAAAVGSKPERRITEALARFAGMDDLTFLPFEPDSLDAAMLAGRSLVEQAPRSAIRLAIRALADGLVPARSQVAGASR